MQLKKEILDSLAIERAFKRISHEIIENNKGVSNVVLIGIAKGGVPICERLAKSIFEIEKINVPIGKLDITHYRDDLGQLFIDAHVTDTDINFSIKDKDVVLCDDVLFTGRSVRAGIDALITLGRPKTIQLAVLIDRGHRELPIRADYVGKNVPTSRSEVVLVTFDKENGSSAVILDKKTN